VDDDDDERGRVHVRQTEEMAAGSSGSSRDDVPAMR
jgi:hypothetical protein